MPAWCCFWWIAEGDVDFVGSGDKLLDLLGGGDAEFARLVGELVELFTRCAGVHFFEGLVELEDLVAGEAGGFHDIGIGIVEFGSVGDEVFEFADAGIGKLEDGLNAHDDIREVGQLFRCVQPVVSKIVYSGFLVVEDLTDFTDFL